MNAMSGNFDPNAYLTDRLFRSGAAAGMAAGTEAAPTANRCCDGTCGTGRRHDGHDRRGNGSG